MNEVQIPENGIVVTTVTVLKEWLDYNDHMNVAYYVAAFDLGVDAVKVTVGIDSEYIETRKRSTVALEAHITYQNEASLDERLRIETRVIDFDGKRTHLYQEMYRDGDLLATQETLSISFDLEARRTSPFEAHVARNYERMLDAQKTLPRPVWVGRRVNIRQAKPST
jgi:acyl-CoA thioester hydrolase